MNVQQARATVKRLDQIMRRGVKIESLEYREWTEAQSELAWHEEISDMAEEYAETHC
jgi:hypothetical protein